MRTSRVGDHIILPPLRLKQIWQCRNQKHWVRIQQFNSLTVNGWVFDAIHPPIDGAHHNTISGCTFKRIQGGRDCYACGEGLDDYMDLVRLLYEAPDVE